MEHIQSVTRDNGQTKKRNSETKLTLVESIRLLSNL